MNLFKNKDGKYTLEFYNKHELYVCLVNFKSAIESNLQPFYTKKDILNDIDKILESLRIE